jgi:hypothetical protein
MGSRIDIDDNLVIEKYNELKNLKKVAKSFGVSLVAHGFVQSVALLLVEPLHFLLVRFNFNI